MSITTKAGSPALPEALQSPQVPAAPESSGSAVKKRKRLAKAFPRPLDKEFKEAGRARVKFSVRADEYAQLVELQQRLVAQGLIVKKGALLRAGLRLLGSQDDGELRRVLAGLLAVD